MEKLQTEFEFVLPKGYVDSEGRAHRRGTMRLATAIDEIAPLRERKEDMVGLAEWWLKNSLAELGALPGPNLHAELQTCAPLLHAWHWPGNVRELRNLMQRVALFLAVEP